MTWTEQTSTTIYRQLTDANGAVLATITIHEAGSTVQWVSARTAKPEAWDAFATYEEAVAWVNRMLGVEERAA